MGSARAQWCCLVHIFVNGRAECSRLVVAGMQSSGFGDVGAATYRRHRHARGKRGLRLFMWYKRVCMGHRQRRASPAGVPGAWPLATERAQCPEPSGLAALGPCSGRACRVLGVVYVTCVACIIGHFRLVRIPPFMAFVSDSDTWVDASLLSAAGQLQAEGQACPCHSCVRPGQSTSFSPLLSQAGAL